MQILICHNDEASGDVLRAACTAAAPDCEIVETSDRAGFEKALTATPPPDVVLSTFGCHKLDGPVVAGMVAKHAPGCPLLFLADPEHEDALLELVGAGRADYVLKGSGAEARVTARIRAALRDEGEQLNTGQTPGFVDSPDFAEALLETVGAIVLILDVTGRIVRANRACRDLTGHDETELEGKSVIDLLVPPEERGQVEAVFESLVTGNFPITHVNRFVAKSGEERWIRWNNTVIRDAEHRVRYVVGTGLDITDERTVEQEREALEQQLLQAAKLESLGVLAGGIAHDFNNLLMGVLGSAELIMAELPPESPSVEDARGIKEAALHGAELTRKMLAYAGRGPVSLAPVDLNELIDKVRPLLRTAVAPSVVLRNHFGTDLPRIRADESQIQQLLVALVTNAAEAIDDRSGYITISTGVIDVDDAFRKTMVFPVAGRNGSHVFLRVEDTGPGISPAVLPRIFEPFYSTKFTGRGLGLASVSGIVRSHGGGIRVDNRTGNGCSFLVVFPAIAEGHTGETTFGARIPGAGRRGHGVGKAPLVLLADDEPLVRAVTKRLLERAGYRVIEAEDGREAVSLFLERAAAVVLAVLDAAMPHKGGAEAAVELRGIRPDLPIIVSSGYDEYNLLSRGGAGVGVTFLQKPYDADDLYEAIRKALGEQAVEQDD